jgi:hypothetical protein
MAQVVRLPTQQSMRPSLQIHCTAKMKRKKIEPGEKRHFTIYFTTGLVFIIKRYPDVDNIKSALQIIFLDTPGFLENEISLLAAKVL